MSDINERGNFLYLVDKDRTNERWTVCMIKYVGDEDAIIQGTETLERRRKVWTDDDDTLKIWYIIKGLRADFVESLGICKRMTDKEKKNEKA